jgi:hypothetical protein
MFVLEGGYDPKTLFECVSAVLSAMAGDLLQDDETDTSPYPEISIDSLLEQVATIHKI